MLLFLISSLFVLSNGLPLQLQPLNSFNAKNLVAKLVDGGSAKNLIAELADADPAKVQEVITLVEAMIGVAQNELNALIVTYTDANFAYTVAYKAYTAAVVAQTQGVTTLQTAVTDALAAKNNAEGAKTGAQSSLDAEKSRLDAEIASLQQVVTILSGLSASSDGLENIFLQPYPGNRNNWNGEVGYEIEAKRLLNVVAMGRSIYSGGKLDEVTQVTLWDVESQGVMGILLVGPSSITEKGFSYEMLPSDASIQLLPGKKYRLSQTCYTGMADKWNDASTALNEINYIDSSVTFIQGVYSSQGNIYPASEDGVGRRPGMVTLYIRG